MTEKWKSVVGYEDTHEVSSHGRVRSLPRLVDQMSRHGTPMTRFIKGKVLSQQTDPNGYRSLALSADAKDTRFLVHRLVLGSFIGPPGDGLECCHCDGDQGNNNLENLRWDTRSNNHKDKVIHGTNNHGEKHPNAKLTREKVLAIRKLYSKTKATLADLANLFDISVQHTCDIVHKRKWAWLED
jgi:hypothetical protein